MALEMKAGSKWWYLRFRDGKKIRQVRLDVKVQGIPPSGPDDHGDRLFRASKAEAEIAHDRALLEIRGDPGAEKAIQRIVQLKTGAKVVFPALADLYEHWKRIPRRKQPNPRYAAQCKSALEEFAAFIRKKKPEAVQFVQVTSALAQAYLDHREAQKVSTKTWNDTLKLLRATFKHLHPQLAEGQNPFHRMVTRTLETVNRQPFSPEELQRILTACEDDNFIRPIIVTGMCTAMRRGDCCLLLWDDVDLKAGFVMVKTSKTGETVDIPIFALFREELLRAEATKDASDALAKYVFPKQALMYLANATGITLRVQRVLCAALGGPVQGQVLRLEEVSQEETRKRGLTHIASLPNPRKAGRMKALFEAYMDGQNLCEAAETAEVSKACVSGHLAELEVATGCRIVRGGHQEGASFAARMRADTSVLHAKRQVGARRASIRDFHSFRVTWITIALAAGVPLEIVQRVTGHRTVDVVLKHYFRPGREDFRRTLENAMPRLFLGSANRETLATAVALESEQTPKEKIINICATATAKTWKTDLARIAELTKVS